MQLLAKYGTISENDYNYLLAISREANTYEGFVAVTYAVINRAVNQHKTIAEIVSAKGQYEAFDKKYIGVVTNSEVDRAIIDIMNGRADNPIGDCEYYFGRVNGYNLWIEDYEKCGHIVLCNGNIFYTKDDYGKIHNMSNGSKQYEQSSYIVYDAKNGAGWANHSKDGVVKE